MTRLNDGERRERDVAGGELQGQITDLAELLGWKWCHWRPAKSKHGWRVPVEGPLGEGWPDLTLVRERDRRLIFAEIKRELEQLSPAQVVVLNALRRLSAVDGSSVAVELARIPAIATVEVYVWRPSDLRDPIEDSVIGRILR